MLSTPRGFTENSSISVIMPENMNKKISLKVIIHFSVCPHIKSFKKSARQSEQEMCCGLLIQNREGIQK